MGGFVGQIVPLVRVLGHFIEFFTSLTMVDVMKTLRANGMIGANPVGGMGDHCRVRPLGLWIGLKFKSSYFFENFIL